MAHFPYFQMHFRLNLLPSAGMGYPDSRLLGLGIPCKRDVIASHRIVSGDLLLLAI